MHPLKVIFKCLFLAIVCQFQSYAGQITEHPIVYSIFRHKRDSSWVFVDPDDTDIHDSSWVFEGPHNRYRHKKDEQPDETPAPPPPDPEDPDPCVRELPKRPNFLIPGRRISEAKCDEFIWDLKHRDDERIKEEECDAYRYRQGLGILTAPSVIGGRITVPGEFPHMGAIGWKEVTGGWRFLCGCFLISAKFVLTAAHCSRASSGDTSLADVNPDIVRLGARNLFDLAIDVKIDRVVVHPEYAPPKKYNDIALIELENEIFLDKSTQPACLWTNFDTGLLGDRAIATGWGYTDLQNRQTANELQAAEVDIIDSSQCDALLRPTWNRHFSGLQPHQLCAGVLAGGVDTCQGDSGGPLQVKIPLSVTTEGSMSYIIGVTSFGVGCARANSPGVYTRVSSFLDWIEDIVWREQK